MVKPTVSVAARDTGRFGPEQADEAAALIAAIGASGRTTMVQPYLSSVDTHGETAVVFIDGEPAHTLHTKAVLRPGEIAPTRDDLIGAAEAMYDPDLVRAAPASADEIDAARAVVAEVVRLFGKPPLYARVDSVRDADGRPVLLELEAVEPALYLGEAPGTAELLAGAILARAARHAEDPHRGRASRADRAPRRTDRLTDAPRNA